MTNKIFLLMAIIVGVGWGAIRYVGDGPTDSSTFVKAHTASSSGDTIYFRKNDTLRPTSGIALKACLYKSEPAGPIYTIYCKPYGNTIFDASTNVIRWDSLNLGYYDTTIISGTSQLMRRNTGGGYFRNSRFFSGTPWQVSNKRGFYLNKASTTNKIDIYNCVFDSVGISALSPTSTTVADSVYITYCTLNEASILLQDYGVFRYNIFKSSVSNGVAGSWVYWENNYCDCKGGAVEWLGSDPNDYVSVSATQKHIYVRNNVFVNGAQHAIIMADGWDSSEVSGNRFYCGVGSIYYNHNNKTRDSSAYITLANNAFFAPSGNSAIIFPNKNPAGHSNNISILRNFFTLGNIGLDSVSNSTVQYSLHTRTTNPYTITPASYAATWTITDTMLGRSILSLTDTVYCFVNRDTTYATITAGTDSTKYIGPSGYLLFNTDTTIGENSFTVACSLSGRFWNTDPVNKDSGAVGIRISTDKSTWYDTVKTAKFKAGTVSNTVVSNLGAGTYYFKVYSIDDSTKGLHDTIPIDSLTIVSTAIPDTIAIYGLSATHGATGDTLDMSGKYFSNATVAIDGSPCTIIDQNTEVIRFITTSKTAGTYNLVVSDVGKVPDTITFTYDTESDFDTIFVDNALTEYTNEYNPATQAHTGGTFRATPTIQAALDSTETNGFHILIREGAYNEVVTLPYNRNGTSWVKGNYNIVEGYQNEFAFIDGGNDSAYVIGILSDNTVTRATRYWKFKHLDVSGGRKSSTNASASGFHVNKGPLIIDSCVIHDNYKTVVSGDIGGGIVGYGWDGCIIQNCLFYNNGDSLGLSDNWADIALYSSYTYTRIDTGYTYFTGVPSRVRNIIRNNYFKSGTIGGVVGLFGKGGEVLAGQNLDGESFNYNYKNFGDKIYNNVFENRITGIRWPTTYAQIHHNILVDCYTGAMTSNNDAYMIQGACMYNNTGIRCRNVVCRLANTDYAKNYTTNYERNLYGWLINNLSDSSAYENTYNTEEFAAIRTSGDATASYDSTYVSRNYSWNPATSDNDATGVNFYMERENRYTTETYTKSRNFLNAYNGSNLLWSSLFIADSNHIIVDAETDTLIKNGGVSGNHPYLTGETIPEYVGAAITGDTWVGGVRGLDSLGQPPTPVAITIQPQDLVFPFGVFTDTFVYMTSNAAHYNWNMNGEWLNTDNDTLSFEAHSGMDGWLVFGYAYTGDDTARTDTITLTEADPPQVRIDSIYGKVNDVYIKDTIKLGGAGDTLIIYGSGFGTEGMIVFKGLEQQIVIDSSDTILKVIVIPIVGLPDTLNQIKVINQYISADSADVFVWENQMAPFITVQADNDTVIDGGIATAAFEWTGTNVRYAWWYYHGGDSTYTFDSVLTKRLSAVNDNDSAKIVLWNTADTISGTVYFRVVHLSFDSVSTSDSLTAYFHGFAPLPDMWTGTIGRTQLTPGVPQLEESLSFSSETKFTLKKKRYRINLTNGQYSLALNFGTGNQDKIFFFFGGK